MPRKSSKNPKVVRVIKSVNAKTDKLVLTCEWQRCEIVFENMQEFIQHTSRHLHDARSCVLEEPKQDSATFYCQWRECGNDEGFNSFTELARHVYFHTFHTKLKCIGAALSEKNSLATCLLDSSSRNTIPELPDVLLCCWSNCQEVFENAELYYEHVAAHADVYDGGNRVKGGCQCQWEDCATVSSSKHRLKEHLRSHTQERTVACFVCGGLFSNATKLFDHIQRQANSETNQYECSYCKRRCSTERLLRDHMRSHVNHYRCPFCEMTCPSPSALRKHVHYRHTETREYRCEQCDYCAKSAVDLRRHEDGHAPVWIECEFENCTYHAKYLWEMRLHCRNTHQGAEIKRYLCELCGKKYVKAVHLTNHLCKLHQYKRSSGHTRFRYKQHEDGYYRLVNIRYESVNLAHSEDVVAVVSVNPAREANNDMPAVAESSSGTDLGRVNVAGNEAPSVNCSVKSEEGVGVVVTFNDVEGLDNVVEMPPGLILPSKLGHGCGYISIQPDCLNDGQIDGLSKIPTSANFQMDAGSVNANLVNWTASNNNVFDAGIDTSRYFLLFSGDENSLKSSANVVTSVTENQSLKQYQQAGDDALNCSESYAASSADARLQGYEKFSTISAKEIADMFVTIDNSAIAQHHSEMDCST